MRCTDVTRFVVVGTLKADTPAIQTEVAMCFHKTRIDVEATGINTFFVFQWLDAFADLGDLAILNANVGNVRLDAIEDLEQYSIDCRVGTGMVRVEKSNCAKEYRSKGKDTGYIKIKVNVGNIEIN